MKNLLLPLVSGFSLAILVGLASAAVPNHLIRSSLENVASKAAGKSDARVVGFQSEIAPLASAPGSNGKYLTEYSIGAPFAATFAAPYEGFAEDVLRNGRAGNLGVLTVLYPPGYGQPGGITVSRDTISASDSVFRGKYLTYGEDPDAVGTPTIVNLADSDAHNSWFDDDDRMAVRAQIEILRNALAYAPQNVPLQEALLNVHYDWAVAETQFAQSKRKLLAKVRMGFLASTPVGDARAIDAEIMTMDELLATMECALGVYLDLLEFRAGGVNPTDYDATANNAPLGYYLFRKLVPARSQNTTLYATSTGVTSLVDSSDQPIEGFAGYKDFRTLYTLLAHYYQYSAGVARLRGMRNEGDDITLARNRLTAVHEYDNRIYEKLEGLFVTGFSSSIDFDDPAFDGTGVRAAKRLVSNARSEVQGVRTFLNGASNHLGLDPNFLLLVAPSVNDSADYFDSYDMLMERLIKRDVGENPVGPLAIAQDSYGDPLNPTTGGGAHQAYSDFRANVDTVAAEFIELQANLIEEFHQLTGYDPDDDPGFDGVHPAEFEPSRLAAAEAQITALGDRNSQLIDLTSRLIEDSAAAQKAVTLARGIEATITGAQAQYLDDTAAAWTEMHKWAGAAAGAQAAFDAFTAASSVSSISSFFTAGGANVAVGLAGAANTAVQTTAAVRTSERQQEIEEAAIAMDITIATAGLPLTVQQQIMDLNDLYREALSHKLEVQSNWASLNQALSERNGILREAQVLLKRFEIDYSSQVTSYYADPIFYIRAETALRTAVADFEDAQRWTFFTCRALEYKWQQRFEKDGYNIHSIITARNYPELERIRQKMAAFNNSAWISTGAESRRNVISLRDHILSPNPDDPNLDFDQFLIDNNFRWSPDPDSINGGAYVDKVTRFRELLRQRVDSNGNLIIDIDTTKLRRFGDFFRGPDFSNPDNSFSGDYRNKIMWFGINVIAADAPESEFGGNYIFSYGGNTWFRTRVPVHPSTREPATTVVGSQVFNPAEDIGGEYNIAPFRYYQQESLDLSEFSLLARQNVGGRFLYSPRSVLDNNGTEMGRIEDPMKSYRKASFRELSVATSQLTLQIDVTAPDRELVIDNVIDIEIVVQSQSYARPQID